MARSNNASDDGHLADISLGVGVPWEPQIGHYNLRIIPLAGYSYHEQRLEITDGNQTIPNTGPFPNLNSEYLPRWKGSWVGVNLSLNPSKKVRVFSDVEFHWASLKADADWNLRTDFSHPKSFRHLADGGGWVTSFGLGYAPWEDWLIQLTFDYQDWSTDPGIIKFFHSDGSVTEQPLNVVDWESFAVSLGATAKF